MNNPLDTGHLLESITGALDTRLQTRGIIQPAMIGIHTGGAWIAQHLHTRLNLQQPLGTLDITFYRDDFQAKGLHPSVKSSELPFSTQDQHIILVDDVIMTGRTIRAATNELFDYGRPASVTLVAMIDLNARELPIQPDIIGTHLDLGPRERVKLTGPEPLQLDIIEIGGT